MTSLLLRVSPAFRVLLCLWITAFLAASQGRDDAPRSPTNRPTVLVLGDSLAAGLGVDPAEAFPALLQRKVDAEKLPHLVINAGVSGDTSAGGLRRIDWLLKQRVDVLLLELGGNDGLRGLPLSATRTNLQGILDKARARDPQMKLVIAGMQMPPNLGEDYTTQFRDLFPGLARTNHAVLIPFLLEDVAGKPELNQADQIHPTAEGHAVIATNVWRVLEKVLKSDRAR